jgi:predicted enzyme related to lactoylglutathione lyase
MHGNTVYVSLGVQDVERAAEFYAAVLGWQYEPANQRGTRVVAGMAITHGIVDGSSAEGYYQSIGLDWPANRRWSGLYFSAAVHDVASAVARVRAAGGRTSAAAPSPYGLSAECLTPDGLAFGLMQPGEWASRMSTDRHQGDLEYVTLQVPSGERARDFFAAVLGWQAAPGSVPDGFQVQGVRPLAGIAGGHRAPLMVPMYRVDDVDAAVQRVRAGGGTVGEPEAQPYGVTADCVDDQGTAFYLGQMLA